MMGYKRLGLSTEVSSPWSIPLAAALLITRCVKFAQVSTSGLHVIVRYGNAEGGDDDEEIHDDDDDDETPSVGYLIYTRTTVESEGLSACDSGILCPRFTISVILTPFIVDSIADADAAVDVEAEDEGEGDGTGENGIVITSDDALLSDNEALFSLVNAATTSFAASSLLIASEYIST